MATKHFKPSDIVTVRGESKTLTAWAEQLETPVQTVLGRLKRGQSIEKACTTPLSDRGGQNKGTRPDADVLTSDEIDRLINAGNKSATYVRDRALMVMAYRSGLRCDEILSLLTKDVDVAQGTIRVHHGKGDKARVVAMDAAGWAYVAEWSQQRSAWGVGDSSPLFCTQAGDKINGRQIRAMFERKAKAAGITKHVHPHGLRRTLASELASENVALMDIATILGHSNVATTNKYLKQVNPASALNAVRSRAWGNAAQLAATSRPTVPPPDWLTRLRADIGNERLMLVHDARQSETEFKAVVLLFS